MSHDIIDNRGEETLADRINAVLASSDAARFAIGYFFVSGFEAIVGNLGRVRTVRLLVGNVSSRETIERVAQGYRRLKQVAEDLEHDKYLRKTDVNHRVNDTASDVQESVAAMEQTDHNQGLANTLVELIEAKRLAVRVCVRGTLHAKAYIFTYGPIYDERGNLLPRDDKGKAIVGSSNLSLAGITSNTELNVMVHGNDNHDALVRWFDALWDEAAEFDALLMQEIRQSWALSLAPPYDIYLKTLYMLVKDRLEDDARVGVTGIEQALTDFQIAAVNRAESILRRYHGVFVADVVGLGKSFIGAALIKRMNERERHRALVICPPSLVAMWEFYNERYDLNARVMSSGVLREDSIGRNELHKYRDRTFVVIDESHNFRSRLTQRYDHVKAFMEMKDRYCCLITATPMNKSAEDIRHQIGLFHHADKTRIPIDPPELSKYFREVKTGARQLEDILAHLMVRRRRRDVMRQYGFDAATNTPFLSNPVAFEAYRAGRTRGYVKISGNRQFFPQRRLRAVEYNIDETYSDLYQEIRRRLGKGRQSGAPPHLREHELCYARYDLGSYVLPDKQAVEPYRSLQGAGPALRGILRVLLFKRLESSVHAFRETMKRLIAVHERALEALEQGIVAAGQDAQKALYGLATEDDAGLMETLRELSATYTATDFDCAELKKALSNDITVLKTTLAAVEPLTPGNDRKLGTLCRLLSQSPLAGNKVLIFTQYADTASYLYENLNPAHRKDIEAIYQDMADKAHVVARFAPIANKDFGELRRGEPEIRVLIATDVLAEGLNLQDCNNIINYDLHWSPVKLIQRIGRVDRIGSEHQLINAFNFLPETSLDEHLGLREKLHNRIQEIQDTIGEDSKILDETERINEEALARIYSNDTTDYDPEEENGNPLNEAETMLRALKENDPAEFSRIVSLRTGIRSSLATGTGGMFRFFRSGEYNEPVIVNRTGEVVVRDIGAVLKRISCTPETPRAALPPGYNAMVVGAFRSFRETIELAETLKEHVPRSTAEQDYVRQRIRLLYSQTDDSDSRRLMTDLEAAFCRGTLVTAVVKELRAIRKQKLDGTALVNRLLALTKEYERTYVASSGAENAEASEPTIVCTEWLGG